MEKHFLNIETELRRIRNAVDESWGWLFLRGLLRGAGFVIGTVFAIAILGWTLAFFHIIPGLGDIASQLQGILKQQKHL